MATKAGRMRSLSVSAAAFRGLGYLMFCLTSILVLPDDTGIFLCRGVLSRSLLEMDPGSMNGPDPCVRHDTLASLIFILLLGIFNAFLMTLRKTCHGKQNKPKRDAQHLQGQDGLPLVLFGSLCVCELALACPCSHSPSCP